MSTEHIVLRSYNAPYLAEIDKGILESEGIHVRLENLHFSNVFSGSIPVNMIVRQCDAALAKSTLDSVHQENHKTNSEDESDGWSCPHCGSDQIIEYRPYLWLSILILPLLIFGLFTKSKYCSSCHHKFN